MRSSPMGLPNEPNFAVRPELLKKLKRHRAKLEDSRAGRKRGRMVDSKQYIAAEEKRKMNCFKNYKIVAKLGEGAYGVVNKALYKPTGQIFAIKKLGVETEADGIPATTIREIALLNMLQHSGIVKLYSTISTGSFLNLVFEFVDGDLHDYLHIQNQPISSSTIKKWMLDLYSATEFCHERSVVHRDLKPQNILVSNSKQVKIADFGLGREVHAPVITLTHEVVTLWYRSPEILLGCKTYGYGVDVWSLGCIMAELLSKPILEKNRYPNPDGRTAPIAHPKGYTPLFSGDSEFGQLMEIFQVTGTPSEDFWPGCNELKQMQSCFPRWYPLPLESWKSKCPRAFEDDDLYAEFKDVKKFTEWPTALDLIKKCLHPCPEERISAEGALDHEWFTGSPKPYAMSG